MIPTRPKPETRTTVPLLTVEEVARRLNTSTKTVRRRIADGDLPVHRIGRAHRISETDLQTFLAARRR